MLIHHGTCTRLVISVVILYLALSGCSIVQSQEPLSFTATDGTPAASVGGTAGVSTQPAKAGQNAGAPAR